MDYNCPKCGKEMSPITFHAKIEHDKNYEYFGCMPCMVFAKKPKDTDELPMPFSLPDYFDEPNELAFKESAFAEESHYLAANTLGYFFDPYFYGTMQEYYDNTLPHA